jgi:hypothetical protein
MDFKWSFLVSSFVVIWMIVTCFFVYSTLSDFCHFVPIGNFVLALISKVGGHGKWGEHGKFMLQHMHDC